MSDGDVIEPGRVWLEVAAVGIVMEAMILGKSAKVITSRYKAFFEGCWNIFCFKIIIITDAKLTEKQMGIRYIYIGQHVGYHSLIQLQAAVSHYVVQESSHISGQRARF